MLLIFLMTSLRKSQGWPSAFGGIWLVVRIFLAADSFTYLLSSRCLASGRPEQAGSSQTRFHGFEPVFPLDSLDDTGPAFQDTHHGVSFRRSDFSAPDGLRHFLRRLVHVLCCLDRWQIHPNACPSARRTDALHAERIALRSPCIASAMHLRTRWGAYSS